MIAISNSTPDKDFPGAMAYAQPFAGRILVFCDRIDKSVPQMRTRLLAYMCSPMKIAHILQGIVRHSDSGIMKAHWDHDDLREMFSMDLKFTTYDTLLIHRGNGYRRAAHRRWTARAREVNPHTRRAKGMPGGSSCHGRA
jgi:hypothetical protein